MRIDIVDIPFENETFDLIIANSMLYHVKEIELALSEVRRVLKKQGLFYCSTLGLNGMQLRGKQFEKVERRDYDDSLEIDIVEDYLEYIYSMASMQDLEQKYYNTLLNCFMNFIMELINDTKQLTPNATPSIIRIGGIQDVEVG